MGRLIQAVAVVVCVGWTPSGTEAYAEEPPAATDDQLRAKELYGNGVTLYEEGLYEDAIAAWEQAYALSNKALLLYNIANAYERLGELQRALDSLNRYRAFAPLDEKEALDRRMRNIERRMEELALQAPPTVVTRPSEPAPIATTPVETSGSGGLGAAPIVFIAGGAVATGTGVVFGLGALSARKDATAVCRDSDLGVLCPDSASAAITKDATQSLLADISLGVGVVCTGVGLTLALTQAGSKTSVRAGASPGGVWVHGAF